MCIPYPTVSYHNPLGRFCQARRFHVQEGANAERHDTSSERSRLWMLRTPTVLTTALFQLWKYRPLKIGRGECDGCDIYTVVYVKWQKTEYGLLGYGTAGVGCRIERF